MTGAVIAASLTLAGCRGCNDDSPYTPFGVASALPDPTPQSPPPPASSSAEKPTDFVEQTALEATPQATTWELGGQALKAPDGSHFVQGLAADFDADGTTEAVALVAPNEGVAAELWSFPPTSAPKRVWQAPSFLPSGPGCHLVPGLVRSGPRSVTVNVVSQCTGDLLERVPTRALAVLAPFASDPVILTLRAADPAPGEELTLRVLSEDQDADGRDDVLLEVAVREANTTPPAIAQLAWLDRAAGPSPVPGQPERSLAGLARTAVERADQKNTAREALQAVANGRRLVASLCAESQTPRLFDDEGSAVHCTGLDAFHQQLAGAEVRAWLALDDVLSAIGVLTRDGWYHTPLPEGIRRDLTGRIESRVTQVEPTEVSRLLARTPPREPAEVRWSPLAFEQPDPTLLVRTPAGLIRASADGSREQPANPSSGARPWPLEVEVSGSTWQAVAQACGRSDLLATFQPASVAARPLPGVLSARPGACGGREIPPVPAPIPLGPATNGLEAAIVAGARIGSAEQRARPGLSRSPDGQLLVVPTALGLLVQGGTKTELWSAPELAPTHQISDCVVANQASAVACVKGTEVILARR